MPDRMWARSGYEAHKRQNGQLAIQYKDLDMRKIFSDGTRVAVRVLMDGMPSLDECVMWHTPYEWGYSIKPWSKYTFYREKKADGLYEVVMNPFVEGFATSWMTSSDAQEGRYIQDSDEGSDEDD
ncbi:uncharacterized protein L201_006719 [Kwoniella dendrophila CBS 6074]|uniref:Uncharacterized protein n=1 Tax=Kwoniella dendrophila CBS 6074 TaxID=1295534 RepID=A0AAX4K2H5_9TREE